MSYITARLMGGLGNQLFQIAAAAAQAIEHDMDFFLLENDPDFYAVTGSNPSKYYSTLYSKIPRRSTLPPSRALPYNERGFAYTDFTNYAASCKKNGAGLILKGYFQSERYFVKHAALIKALFTPSEGLDAYIRTHTNLYSAYPELDPSAPTDHKRRAFIGVRRGDYCKDAHMISVHNPASMNYYRKAMAQAKADVYYVMSDDIAWCKEQFKNEECGPQFIFFEEPDDLRSFFFARLFQNYICANSTFHWWASYLSIYPNPIVYTPKEHFGPAGPQDYQDYFRPEMIRISNQEENPPITINIPLYNGIQFLPETIASVKGQTYPHWTCIIGVNGHGPDGGDVFKEASALVAGDGRFRVVNYPEARCVADVDNMMVADSPAEWIAHLDADDIWESTKLEAQVTALQGPAAGADVIGTDCTYFGERGGKPSIKTGWVSIEDMLGGNQVINSSTLLRKSVASYSSRFVCEDYDLWLSLALKGKKIYNLPQTLVRHRIYSQSNFNASNKQDPGAVVRYYVDQEPYTLVTAFYEMRSKFPPTRYLQWIDAFYRNYPGYMVIYTDEKYKHVFEAMRSAFKEKTRIICLPRNEWGAMKDFPTGFWEAQHTLDHEKDIHSPELYMIWYQKNDFVQRTIRANPFGHQKFMWCDAGVVREPFFQECVKHMIHGQRILADKMSVLEISPITAEEKAEYATNGLADFHLNKNRIGGGILAGGIHAWKTWDLHYRDMITAFNARGWFVGKDQNLFANMVLRWPRDVHVVRVSAAAPRMDPWFYFLYYYACGHREFASIA